MMKQFGNLFKNFMSQKTLIKAEFASLSCSSTVNLNLSPSHPKLIQRCLTSEENDKIMTEYEGFCSDVTSILNREDVKMLDAQRLYSTMQDVEVDGFHVESCTSIGRYWDPKRGHYRIEFKDYSAYKAYNKATTDDSTDVSTSASSSASTSTK